jgi:sterol desaturase/sphingolipid hydroxylase (fatty acid hydroxylase superfamily)
VIPLGLTSFAMPVARLAAWLVLLAILFIPLERMFALRPAKIFRPGSLTDLGYYFLNGIVPGLFLSVPIAATAWATHRLMPDSVTAALAHLPMGVRFFAAFVVTEAGLYWGHRWSHEIPLLWRFHAVHHSPTRVDWLVNSRGHPVDFVFTRLCGLVPLSLLGLAGDSTPIPLLVLLPGAIWGFFIHANVRWRFGPLEWLIATPAFHHWHHSNDDPEALNKNFAPTFPWIDRLFGTLHLPKDRQPLIYGTDSTVPPGMGGQLIEPFVESLRRQKPRPQTERRPEFTV